MTNYNFSIYYNELRPVVILGGMGALGTEIYNQLILDKKKVINLNRSNFQISSEKKLHSLFENLSPSLVINCIAMTGIDRCAVDRNTAIAVNGHFPGILYKVCKYLHIPLIHFSTDNVFSCDDPKNLPSEHSIPYPTTWYGVSKYLGESLIGKHEGVLVIRLPMLFGPTNKHQLVSRLLEQVRLGHKIKVSQDVFTTPLYTPDAARWIVNLINSNTQENPSLLHFSGSHHLSLYDLMLDILRSFNLDDRVEAVSSSSFTGIDFKPPYGGLKSICLKEFSYEDALHSYRKVLKNFFY